MCFKKRSKHCDSFVRVAVIIFNAMSMFTGVLIITGVLVLRHSDPDFVPGDLLDKLESQHVDPDDRALFNNALIVALATGVFALFTGLIGLVGACARNQPMIIVLIVLQCAFFALEVFVAIDKSIEAPHFWFIGSCVIFVDAMIVLTSFCLAVSINGGGQVQQRQGMSEMENEQTLF
jgi:hypothetical protein